MRRRRYLPPVGTTVRRIVVLMTHSSQSRCMNSRTGISAHRRGSMLRPRILLVAAILFVFQPAVSFTLRPSLAESQADDCRAKPGAAGPAGSHWYYRLKSTDGRRCWFLGKKGMKVRLVAPEESRRRVKVARRLKKQDHWSAEAGWLDTRRQLRSDLAGTAGCRSELRNRPGYKATPTDPADIKAGLLCRALLPVPQPSDEGSADFLSRMQNNARIVAAPDNYRSPANLWERCLAAPGTLGQNRRRRM
jgi:hypothetical protein